MASSFGPIVTTWTVEQAVRDTLTAWIDTILSEQERQSVGRWDLREIQRPRSWFIQSAFHEVPVDKLPAIHVESSNVIREHADGGRVNGQYPMVVQGLVKAKNRALSREILGVYESACAVILDKHGALGGLATATAVGDSRLDLVPGGLEQTLLGFEIEITVTVADIANRFGGPDTPDDPAPTPPPSTSPEDPAHTSTTVTVSEL